MRMRIPIIVAIKFSSLYRPKGNRSEWRSESLSPTRTAIEAIESTAVWIPCARIETLPVMTDVTIIPAAMSAEAMTDVSAAFSVFRIRGSPASIGLASGSSSWRAPRFTCHLESFEFTG